MIGTMTVTKRTETLSEKFKRGMRTLIWEALDEGMIFYFRVKAAVAQIRLVAHMTPVAARHLFASR
ncbi:MAG: hypothetical protein H7836_09670 [Magnetococcus sp. YQC-3]